MIAQYHKLALTAGFALAMALTFSCSGDGDDNPPPAAPSGGSSSSGGGSSSSGGIACATWGDWVITPATCEAKGLKTRTCTSGTASPETEEIPQLNYVWTVTTSATCVAAGVKTGTCPNNASPAKTEPIAKLEPTSTQLCDTRDGKLYKFVTIGEGATAQKWMAENLNYAVGGKCYAEGVDGVSADSIAKNCATYGRLYNWATAMGGSNSSTANPSGIQGVCPSGWHLPSDAEWNVLMKFVSPSCTDNGDCADAGKKLKADSPLWNSNGKGTDDYGFSALPGGCGYSNGNFDEVGGYSIWWSASENDSYYAYYMFMDYSSEYFYYRYDNKGILYSVRCLQDSP